VLQAANVFYLTQDDSLISILPGCEEILFAYLARRIV